MAKINDWFAARLFQPDYTLVDFYAHNITPDNSDLKPMEDYKNLPEVQEKFKDQSGKFDEKKFNDFYNTSLALYNQYDGEEVEKRLLEAYVHDPYEWYTPGNETFREIGAKIVLGKNPLGDSQGIKGLLYNGPSQFSIRELAQREKVQDQNGNELDWSPNDRGGLFKGLTRPTLVLAQWDEDGTHEVDGEIRQHKKGDLKYNSNGRPYYELLGDREMYGKDLLHYTDTLTIDGEGLNAIDVFDNDGINKSLGGTLMKTALTMGPLLIPGVGPVYGAIRASIATAQILPVLGKTLNSIFTGDAENEFGKTLNKLESWTSRFNSSVSDEGREKMLSAENLGSMINAIGGQLFEQRVVGSIPLLLNKYGNITKNTQAGQKLALAYMAATSAKDTYQSFKEAGASDRMAGIAMAANVFALWKLMNIDYFRKTLFKGSYLDDNEIKGITKAVSKEFEESLAGKADDVAKEVIEKGSQGESKKAFKWLSNSFIKKTFDKLKNSELAQRSFSEGVEEVLEENVSDLSKVFTLGLEALGVPVSEEKLDFGYTPSEIFSRYAMTFAGGAVGGAIFHGFGKWEKFIHPESAAAGWDSLDDIEKLTYFIANGRKDEIQSYLDKWHQNGRLGSTNLSADEGEALKLPGKEGEWTAKVDSKYTQNDAVYNAMTNSINYLDQLINEENLTDFTKRLPKVLLQNIPQDNLDDKFTRASILNLVAAQSGMMRDFNRIGARILQIRSEITKMTDSIKAKAKNDSKEETAAITEQINNNAQIKNLQQKLLELRTERDKILNGERNDYYVARGLFRLDGELNKNFINLTKNSFAQAFHNVDYGSLTQEQKEIIDQDYSEYLADQDKYKMDLAFDVYSKISERYAQKINNLDQVLKGFKQNKQYQVKTQVERRNELIKEQQEIQAKHNELLAKTDKTKEDKQQLEEWMLQFNNLEREIQELNANPGLFLSYVGAPNTEVERVQRILLDRTLDQEALNQTALQLADNKISKEDAINKTRALHDKAIYEIGNLLKTIYGNYKSSKTILNGDVELDRFYDWVREEYKAEDTVLNKLHKYGIAYKDRRSDLEGLNDEEVMQEISKTSDASRDIFRYDDISPIQEEFASKFEAFINTFGKDNKKALQLYEDAKRFLKEQTNLSDSDINDLMIHLTPKIGDQLITDYIKEVDDIRKDITYSPFNEIFSEFVTDLTGEKLPILDIIKNEELHLSEAPTLQDYTIENPFVVQELENANDLLNVFSAVVTGAYDGLNATANKYKKVLGKPLYGILSDKSAKLLSREITAIQSKINTLLGINKMNGQNKLTVQKKIAANMRPKYVKLLLDPVYSKVIRDTFKSITGDDFDLQAEWDNIKPDNFDWDSIDDSNYDKFESEFIKLETIIYDKLSKLDEDQYGELLSKLFTKEISYMTSSKLTDNKKEELTPYDMAVYLTTIASLNSNDFYAKLKGIVEDPGFSYAPLFGQEFAVRVAVANALHPSKFNVLLDKLKTIDNNIPEQIKKKETLYNMSFIFGGAGVGKTVVIAKLLYKILDDPTAEFAILAPSETQSNKLKKESGIKTDIVETQETIFKKISTNENGIESNNIEFVKGGLYARLKNIDAKDTDPLFSATSKLKYLFIDEVACFSSPELTLLSRYAQKNGIFIIGLGDRKQTSAKINYETEVNEKPSIQQDFAGIEDTLYIKAPTLTASVRADNIAKLLNYNALDLKVSNVLDKYAKHPEWNAIDISDATTQELNTGITLKYYDGNNRLIGDLAVKDSESLITYINKVLPFDGATIAIYTDNPSKYATFADKKNVAILPADNINGGEYTYAFVDIDWSKQATVHGTLNKFSLLQNLYTVTQRSKVATVFVNNGLVNFEDKTGLLNINLVEDTNVNAFPGVTDKSINDFKTWRLRGLTSIKPSEHYDESFISEDVKREVNSNLNGNPEEKPNQKPDQKSEEKPEEKLKNKPTKITISPEDWDSTKRKEWIEGNIKNIESHFSVTELSNPSFWKDWNTEKKNKAKEKFENSYDGIVWNQQGESAWNELGLTLMSKYSPEAAVIFYEDQFINNVINTLETNLGDKLKDINTWKEIPKLIKSYLPFNERIYDLLKEDINKELEVLKLKYNPTGESELSIEDVDKIYTTEIKPLINNFTFNFTGLEGLSIADQISKLSDQLTHLNSKINEILDQYPAFDIEAQDYLIRNINYVWPSLKIKLQEELLDFNLSSIINDLSNSITEYNPSLVENAIQDFNKTLEIFNKVSDSKKNVIRNKVLNALNNKLESLKPNNGILEITNKLKESITDKWLEWLNSNEDYKNSEYWKQHSSEILDKAQKIFYSFNLNSKNWKYFGKDLWDEFSNKFKANNFEKVETSDDNIPPKKFDFATNDNDYYSFLNSKDFINFEVNNQNSILNYFGKNISQDTYIKLVTLLESLIKRNKNPKDFIQEIRNILRSDEKQRNNHFEQTSGFLNILQDPTTEISLYVSPYNDKGLLSLVINYGTSKFSVPISFVNTNNKFGKYEGQLTQVQRLSFTKSGNFISLAELKAKYPNLHIGTSWGVVSGPNIDNDLLYHPDTRKFVAINQGKVMTMASSNALDTDKELGKLWEDGSNEGPGYNYTDASDEIRHVDSTDWTYTNHDIIPLMGVHKRVPLSKVITYATAMVSKIKGMRETFDSKYLEELGLIYDKNGVLQDNSIFSLIGNPSQISAIVQPGWVADENQRKAQNSAFFNKLKDPLLQIVPDSRLGQLTKITLFGDIKDENIANTINQNLFNYIKRVPKDNGNKNALLINSFNDSENFKQYVVVHNEHSGEFDVYDYDLQGVGSIVYSIKATGIDVIDRIKEIFDNLDIDINKSSVLFGEVYNQKNGKSAFGKLTANETIVRLFANIPNVDRINELLDDNSRFKYGVFVNDAADGFYEGSTFFRKFAGDKLDYVTDADTWTFPIYQLDESKIIPDNTQIDEKLEEFNSKIETLKQNLRDNHFDESLIVDLSNSTDYDSRWENIINSVNKTLAENTLSDMIPYFNLDGTFGGYIKNTINAFVNNYNKGKQPEDWIDRINAIPLTNVTKSVTNFAVFAVTQAVNEDGILIEPLSKDNAEYYVYQKVGDEIILTKTETYETWKSLYDFGKSLESEQASLILDYIGQLYNDNIDSTTDQKMLDLSIKNPELFNKFQELLIKHLQDKLDNNEC